MIKKSLGYLISLIGVAILAVGVVPAIRTAIKIIPANINDIVIMIFGALIAIVGIFMIYQKSSAQPSEVPIYEGKNLVGFRRVGKK